jgi:hypothetical protein
MLWKVLEKYGIPEKTIATMKNVYEIKNQAKYQRRRTFFKFYI